MSTIEKLFVQIFERKRGIIDQAKHQTHLFDQHLASKLLIDGIAPPPWLWTPPLHAQPSDPNEFNKEELISGVLLPRPQHVIPYTSSHCALYKKPVFAAGNGELPNDLFTQVIDSEQGIDAGDGISSLDQCPARDVGCASAGVPGLDHAAMSPQDARDIRVPNIYHDPALSLARIQRSKSRQKAIELRNSAKAVQSCSTHENDAGGISGSAIASLQNDHVVESVFVNPVATNIASCAGEGEKVGDCWSKGNGSKFYSGRITRSRSSSQQLGSLDGGKSPYIFREDGGIFAGSVAKLNEQSSHGNEPLELAEPSPITNARSRAKKGKRGGKWSKDMGSNVSLGGITSSSQEPNCMKKSKTLDSCCDNEKVDGLSDSKQHCDYDEESLELVKSSVITADGSGVKGKMDPHREEWGGNDNFGRVIRARGPCQSHKNANSSTQAQPMSKSTPLLQSLSFQNGQHPQISEIRSLLRQKDQDLCMENVREHSSNGNSEVNHDARNSDLQDSSSSKISSKEVYSNVSDERVIRYKFLGFSKSDEVQGAQMSAGGSSLKDQQPCTLNAAFYSHKEHVADEYAGTNIRGEAASTIEGIAKHINSSLVLGCKVTHSRSNPTTKHPFAQSLKCSEGIDLKEVSGTQIKVLHGTCNRDTVEQERGAANVMKCEVDSDVLADGRSDLPGSNCDIACLRAGSGVLASRPPSDCTMSMKPNQLDFDSVVESSSNGMSCPPSDKEVMGRLSGTFANPAELMKKVASIGCQAKCGSSAGKPSLEEQDDLSKDKELQKFSSEVDETYEASGSSDENAVRQIKRTSEVSRDAVTHPLFVRDKAYQGKSSLTYHSSILQVDCEDFLGSLPNLMGSNMSNVNADTKGDLSSGKVVVEHDDVQSIKLVSINRKRDISLGGDLRQSTNADFSFVSGSGPFINSDVTLNSSTIDLPRALWVEEMNDALVQPIIHPGISQSPKADSLGRRACPDKQVIFEKSTEDQIAKNATPGGSYSLGLEGSWFQHKRRKIEGRPTNLLSASPSLREEGLTLIDRGSVSENLNDAEDYSKAVLQTLHFSLSPEKGVAQLDMGNSLAEAKHQNEEGHMIEGFESSPRLHVEEVELSLGAMVGSANTPFTYLDDQLRVSLISSLINQAAGDSQGCLAEEVEVVDPNSKIDGSMQCFVEKNQAPLHLEDKLGLEITKHVTCTGRTIQEKRSNFDGTDEILNCSVGSPQSQFLDLPEADEAMPVFEGFILQTDDKHLCTTGNGINFEKLDLPNSAVERASILEELCRSACTDTPFSGSSTSYKLHRIPSLYQSVPNGLLEGMNQRSTLSMNDTGKQLNGSGLREEVGYAFHGRSYSDCLPNSNCQSARNITNPYVSPIGKLWDRIKSNSGSSEKRTSLNPELPCIDEENENADEVAETFPEGICSEVTTSSVKRVPLADITGNPNPPAAVSEVERYADRFSIDSVHTEFRFTRTQTRVKQKLGNQHSHKKRYANKVKENQNACIEANGVKRATESFHNRFGKPKKGDPSFSGRESKPNNIVSNITSFIPLVQQKQAAAVVTGKRDIKVKALEAAGAAKRLAEKKENERKMKKEALKLERARSEQENLRQLGLQKKRKEEEQKKKEADMAAKKRQREGEERKEKERKRKRVEESRRQQREHEEKLCSEKNEKELKYRATDMRTNEKKEYKDETVKRKYTEKIWEADNLGNVSETEPRTTKVSSSDARKASALLDASEALNDGCKDSKGLSNLDKAMESDNMFSNTNKDLSYDISPYKGSDDEDEEDDDVPNSKFIPSWASKHCVALVISSQQRVDPETIFPLESFCNITEVLLPRKHQLKSPARE